jgi:hypothetical protein
MRPIYEHVVSVPSGLAWHDTDETAGRPIVVAFAEPAVREAVSVCRYKRVTNTVTGAETFFRWTGAFETPRAAARAFEGAKAHAHGHAPDGFRAASSSDADAGDERAEKAAARRARDRRVRRYSNEAADRLMGVKRKRSSKARDASPRVLVTDPHAAARVARPVMHDEQETFVVILLNARNVMTPSRSIRATCSAPQSAATRPASSCCTTIRRAIRRRPPRTSP